MSIRALFGLSILMSFVASGLVTRIFIGPRLRVMARRRRQVTGRSERWSGSEHPRPPTPRSTPERVAADYRAFVARLRSALPAARVAFVSIKPSPSRRSFIPRVLETNQRIRTIIARDSLQTYVDVFTPMLDGAGQPRPELFVADSLHMTRAGYLLWRARLAPIVR